MFYILKNNVNNTLSGEKFDEIENNSNQCVRTPR